MKYETLAEEFIDLLEAWDHITSSNVITSIRRKKVLSKNTKKTFTFDLVFDNNDEYWILRENVPIWRSSDHFTELAVKFWNRLTHDKINTEYILDKENKCRM